MAMAFLTGAFRSRGTVDGGIDWVLCVAYESDSDLVRGV